jgi:hypothetical protein
METTAAIPNTIDAVNNSKRIRLALASRHAILNSHGKSNLDESLSVFNV